MKPVTIIIRGLKCDSPGCDYFDETAKPEESSIGMPCPKCGASLLTEEDMAAIRLIQYAAHATNVELGDIPLDEESGRVMIPILMDGTGSFEFGEVERP